jgi:hypothetical protein
MFRSTELSFSMDAAEKDNWDPGKKIKIGLAKERKPLTT